MKRQKQFWGYDVVDGVVQAPCGPPDEPDRFTTATMIEAERRGLVIRCCENGEWRWRLTTRKQRRELLKIYYGQ